MIARRHLANTRLTEEKARHQSLSTEIELAVEQSRDDLAEAAFAAQLDIERSSRCFSRQPPIAAIRKRNLRGTSNRLQAKKREMRGELRQFRAARAKAMGVDSNGNGNAAISSSGHVEQRVERAGSLFERVLERTTGLPAAGDAVDTRASAQLAELEVLARKHRVQERLAAIKSKGGIKVAD